MFYDSKCIYSVYIVYYYTTLHDLWYILCLFSLILFVEVKALHGLCYLLYVYSTQNKSSTYVYV